MQEVDEGDEEEENEKRIADSASSSSPAQFTHAFIHVEYKGK